MGSDFWISYTDILTGLLFIFLLVIICFVVDNKNAIALQNKIKTLEEEKQVQLRKIRVLEDELNKIQNDLKSFKEKWFEADDVIIQLLEKITKELNNNDIHVTLDRTNKTLNIDSTVVGFVSGKHDIQSTYYKKVIPVISNILKRELNNGKVRKMIDAIFIEGYTDDEFFDKPDVFGNWGLSSLRAIAFWDALNKSNNLRNIKNANNTKLLFSVSGYANIRPIDCRDFAYDTNLKGSEKFTSEFKLSRCNYYQECVMGNKDISPDSCLWYLGEELHNEYNTKNRRIGIRFIPYHDINNNDR